MVSTSTSLTIGQVEEGVDRSGLTGQTWRGDSGRFTDVQGYLHHWCFDLGRRCTCTSDQDEELDLVRLPHVRCGVSLTM